MIKPLFAEGSGLCFDPGKEITKEAAIAAYRVVQPYLQQTPGYDVSLTPMYIGYAVLYQPKGRAQGYFHWSIRATCFAGLSDGHFQADFAAIEGGNWPYVKPCILLVETCSASGWLQLTNQLQRERVPYGAFSIDLPHVSFLPPTVAAAA